MMLGPKIDGEYLPIKKIEFETEGVEGIPGLELLPNGDIWNPCEYNSKEIAGRLLKYETQ